MKAQIIARRYVRALGAQLPISEVNTAFEQLTSVIQELTRNARFWAIMKHPNLSRATKYEAFDSILKRLDLHPTVYRWLLLLAKRDRMTLLQTIQPIVTDYTHALLKQVEAEVFAAVELPETTRRDLIQYLETLTGKQVKLKLTLSPDILGGFRVKMNNTIYDATLNNAIAQFTQSLTHH